MSTTDPANDLERLDALAAVLPALEAPDADFGRWEPMARGPDGTYHLPYFVRGPLCDAFTGAVVGGGWLMVGFDWSTWARTDEAQALWKDPDAMARATPVQLARFLTALLRSERFSEGTLEENYQSGLLARIARRAAALAAELRASTDRASGD